MTRVLSKDASKHAGKEIIFKGFIRLRRDHGKLIFLDVRDLFGVIQVVVNAKVSEAAYNLSKKLRPEDVVEIIGKVNKRPDNAVNKDLITGDIELEATDVKIISKAETLPFDMGGENLNLELPTLLDNRSLALRHPQVSAIFKIQETIADTFRNVLKEKNFTEIFVPTIVPLATEGGAEVFEVKYYDKKAFLAQSPQLYKQIMVSVFEKVFTIAHAYRAEPSVTTRHLSEYVSLDAEIGFINSWEELMDLSEEIVKKIIASVKEKNKEELKLFKVKLFDIKNPFPRITLKKAQDIIFERTKIDHRGEPDLNPGDEKEICNWAKEEYGSPFVFITHYPVEKRPFYTMPDPKDEKHTLSFDLLGIQEEWVTGGQRINDYDSLLENMKKWKIDPKSLEIYLQAFRYGMPKEGGFAMGIERITKDLLGLKNIREASLFPRDMERVDEKLSDIK